MRVDKPLWLLMGGASIVVDRVARAGAAVGQQAGRIAHRRGPTWDVDRVSARGRVVAASLASRGEEWERRSRARASQYFDRLLVPLVDRALPIVLDRLGQQREQVRAIVWEHGGDLTGELVAGIRDRAAAADTTAERMVRRLLGGRRDGSATDEQTGDSAPPAGLGAQP